MSRKRRKKPYVSVSAGHMTHIRCEHPVVDGTGAVLCQKCINWYNGREDRSLPIDRLKRVRRESVGRR